jgi:hypothetical protein
LRWTRRRNASAFYRPSEHRDRCGVPRPRRLSGWWQRSGVRYAVRFTPTRSSLSRPPPLANLAASSVPGLAKSLLSIPAEISLCSVTNAALHLSRSRRVLCSSLRSGYRTSDGNISANQIAGPSGVLQPSKGQRQPATERPRGLFGRRPRHHNSASIRTGSSPGIWSQCRSLATLRGCDAETGTLRCVRSASELPNLEHNPRTSLVGRFGSCTHPAKGIAVM